MFLQVDCCCCGVQDMVDLSCGSCSIGIEGLKGLDTSVLCCQGSTHSCDQMDALIRVRHVILLSIEGDDASSH